MSRRFTYALIVIGLVALLAATVGHSSATNGPLFQPFGPASSFGDLGKSGKSLCRPGAVCYTPQQLQAAYDWPTGRKAPEGTRPAPLAPSRRQRR